MMSLLKVMAFFFFLVFTNIFYLSAFSQTKDTSYTRKIFSATNNLAYSYTDVLYTGITCDLDAKNSSKGTWAISMGYRRLIEINKKWGVNFLASFNCFYNAADENYHNIPPEILRGKYDYTRSFFSANIHAAPSYTFNHKFIVYAGVGITFLQASEFFQYSYNGIDITNAWGDMFSKVVGIEFSPAGRFAMNMEYVRTRVNNFFSMKAGMRF